MLRSFVMIKGRNYPKIRELLENSVIDRKSRITDETSVIVECFVESFGWADFLAILWSPNIETLHSAIEIIRNVTGAETTTIVGMIGKRTMGIGGIAKPKGIEHVESKNLQKRIVDIIFSDYIETQKKIVLEAEKKFLQGKKEKT